MSSPGLSSGSYKPAELFEERWMQLKQCHQDILQELEAKVSKLKKERCLDAQRLEVFHNHNQQLKEQNKKLQDAVCLMEERLPEGGCERCAFLEEQLKNNQEKSVHLIAKLKSEKNSVEEENRKAHAEIQKLKLSCSDLQQPSTSEQEEGIIPDSPVLPSSLPAANRLKKHRSVDKSRRIRYTEKPLPLRNNALFRDLNKESVDAPGNPRGAEVLVPNTCDMDCSEVTNGNHEREVIAETCGLELLIKDRRKTEVSTEPQSPSNASWRKNVHSILDSTTERSPSLLPRVKRFSEDNPIDFLFTKRKREESEQEVDKHRIQGVVKTENKHTQIEPIKHFSTLSRSQSFTEVKSEQSDVTVSCASHSFKKPAVKSRVEEDVSERKRNPLQDVNVSQNQREAEYPEKRHKVEATWSIDPALAMSMYESQSGDDMQTEAEEDHLHAEMADTDCTWVSHSMLQGRGENGRQRQDSVCGLGEKANDSLDMMFDATTFGEYKSYNCSHSCLSQSSPAAAAEDDDDEDVEEEERDREPDSPGNTPGRSKSGRPTFAHVEVVRKKDERRKLKGTTCKECEIYYAHLPEEEKQKKLTDCSRHRFRYIPPSTPENFWEVGFPSTQTCIERGYIKEEKNPQARSRRRQPYNALFSQKKQRHLQES